MTDHSDGLVAEDKSLWHYRQFAEFAAIFQNQALWFARLDCLRDPVEGRSHVDSRFFEKADAHTRKGCVSCWTIDDEESELMWYAYAPGDYGLAIRSTKVRLKASFTSPIADRLQIGRVEYGTGPVLPASWAFIKRRGFRRERELRVLLPYEYEYDGAKLLPAPEGGVSVPVDLKSLMWEVCVSPLSKPWFENVVRMGLEKYGHHGIEIKRRH